MGRHGNAAQRRIEEAGRDVDVGNATKGATADRDVDSAGRKRATGTHSSVAAVATGSAGTTVCGGGIGRGGATGSAGTSSATGAARDRQSTRLNPVTNAHLVCRLLLEKKKQIA